MTSDKPSHTPPPGGGRKASIIGKNIVKLREEDGSDRLLIPGQPDFTRCDNTLITSKYTFLNFLPIVSIDGLIESIWILSRLFRVDLVLSCTSFFTILQQSMTDHQKPISQIRKHVLFDSGIHHVGWDTLSTIVQVRLFSIDHLGSDRVFHFDQFAQ